MIRVIYRNQDYMLVNDSFTKRGFSHNFLLFINEGGKRLVYSVQMAVNYVSTLPTASLNQSMDEQTFVACLPISEYPEILDYLAGGSKLLNTYVLADNEAKRRLVLINKLLNQDKTVDDKRLLDSIYKLGQHTRLLEIEENQKPQSVFDFDDLYHIYLNRQRVFRDSLKNKMEARKLSTSLHYLISQSDLSNNDIVEIKSLMTRLTALRDRIRNYNYSWFAVLDKDVEEYRERFNYVFNN